MRGRYYATCLLLAASSGLCAAPPEVPVEVTAPQDKVREIVVKVPDGKILQYRAVGDKVAFREMKTDSKGEAVFWLISETGGRSHIVWWFKNEDGSSATNINSEAAPPTIPPTKPPTDPPDAPPGTATYYFLVIRPDGPASPEFTKIMSLPGWADIKKKGHQYKDKTVSAAAQDINLTLPPGGPMPCVVTLSTTGGVSKIVRGPIALPTTDVGLAAMVAGVK